MAQSTSSFKYGTFIVMVLIWIGTIFNLFWLWGILFLAWTAYIFYTGDATVVEPVNRKDNPGWFWFIALSWLLLSLSLFTPPSWWGY